MRSTKVINAVAKKTGLTATQVKTIINVYLDTINTFVYKAASVKPKVVKKVTKPVVKKSTKVVPNKIIKVEAGKQSKTLVK